jgi:uncharacterized phage protein (TIGR02220 family)
LIKANYKDKPFRGDIVKRGSFQTSIKSLSNELDLSVQAVRTSLKKLESTEHIINESTTKYRIITIINYDTYQTNNTDTPKKKVVKKDLQEDKNKPSKKEIIDYLNFKTNSKYKHETGNTQKVLNARINEGYTLQQFKQAIDNAYNHWSKTDELNQMQPHTLFNTKFESRVTGQAYNWNKKGKNKRPKPDWVDQHKEEKRIKEEEIKKQDEEKIKNLDNEKVFKRYKKLWESE